MLLLEQDIIKKRQVETAIKLVKGKSKEYKVKAIYDNTVYASKLEDYLPGYYYLIS